MALSVTYGATVSLRLSHRTALTLSMSFTTVLPFHYPKWETNLGSPSGRAPRSGERADLEVPEPAGEKAVSFAD